MSGMYDYVATGETYGPIDSPIYMKNGKKYIKVVNGNSSRYLILPDIGQESSVECTQIMDYDWSKLIEKTNFPTMEKRKLAAEEYLKYKNEKQQEVLQRSREMQKALEVAEKTRKLNVVEQEMEYRRKYTLDRANQLLLDQNNLMKEFNQMIALKKCIATWDQQVLEKEKINADINEEKQRQEESAEFLRKKRVKDDELQRIKEQGERLNFITALGEQIKERELMEKVHRSIVDLERDKFNKAAIQSELDELEAFKKKAKQDEKIREEQRRVNILLQRLKAVDREEDRMFFEKQQATQQKIQKELDEIEAEKRGQKVKKQEEVDRIAKEKMEAEKQAKFKDLMEEMLRRDNTERAWRQKELQATEENQKRLDEMFAQLERQVIGQRMAKAQVMEDERREVCKIAKDNIEDEAKDREAERKRKLANEAQRLEILLQINDADRRKLDAKENRVLESNYIKILEDRKMDNLKRGMYRRVDAVKRDGLPEKYVNDLETYVRETYGTRPVKKQKEPTTTK